MGVCVRDLEMHGHQINSSISLLMTLLNPQVSIPLPMTVGVEVSQPGSHMLLSANHAGVRSGVESALSSLSLSGSNSL